VGCVVVVPNSPTLDVTDGDPNVEPGGLNADPNLSMKLQLQLPFQL
jgi:hypothetical protein